MKIECKNCGIIGWVYRGAITGKLYEDGGYERVKYKEILICPRCGSSSVKLSGEWKRKYFLPNIKEEDEE